MNSEIAFEEVVGVDVEALDEVAFGDVLGEGDGIRVLIKFRTRDPDADAVRLVFGERGLGVGPFEHALVALLLLVVGALQEKEPFAPLW